MFGKSGIFIYFTIYKTQSSYCKSRRFYLSNWYMILATANRGFARKLIVLITYFFWKENINKMIPTNWHKYFEINSLKIKIAHKLKFIDWFLVINVPPLVSRAFIALIIFYFLNKLPKQLVLYGLNVFLTWWNFLYKLIDNRL